MKFIADLHIHSHYSMSTGKNANLEEYYNWALIKGINLVGTGDFTHPKWMAELQEKLSDDGSGFFSLKEKAGSGVQCRQIRRPQSLKVSQISGPWRIPCN